MAEELLTMFGKAYNTVGSANSNLILLTRGDIKIRWGNKFIDLIKNGKINAEVDLIKRVDSTGTIHTDGIYLVNNEGTDEVWVMVDGNLINLKGEIGDTYVSYKGILEVTIDEKFVALNNIGLYYLTYDELMSSGLQNGVAFVLEIGKFFTAIDGEIKEYSVDTVIPDPLIVDNITINGLTESIYSNNMLIFGITNSKVLTVEPENLTFHTKVTTNGAISSDNYDDYRGYSIYIDTALDESVAVFDKVIIRKSISYLAEEEITYANLLKLIKNKNLVLGKKYIIIDFLDIRNITYSDEVHYKNKNDEVFEIKNVYPIVVKAKNTEELEPEGYFQENPEWIVEYDPYYNYIVKYKESLEGENAYILAHSKGRILKMTDEFGNSANFDFKHVTFTDENKYLFNGLNPKIKELNKLIEINTDPDTIASLNKEKSATNIYADATQDIDVEITTKIVDGVEKITFERIQNTKITGNTIYLAEPELEDTDVMEDGKLIKLNDYIIFNDCTELYPKNNTIESVKGKYKVLKQFDENNFKEIIYIDENECQINSAFINNTADTINFKNEDGEEVLFDSESIYDSNIFGSITNSRFRKGLTANSFKNLTHVIIDKLINYNTFEQDLLDLHILSETMHHNIFKGHINTYTNIEVYIIDGILTNNTFEEDLECVTFESTCVISDTQFTKSIKYQNSVYTTFKGKISKCQFGQISGCIFNLDSLLYNVLFYNENLYMYTDMTLVTIDKSIRNSLFKDNILNIHLYGDIDKITSEGSIGNELIESSLGKVEFTTFVADIENITAERSTISYSQFSLIKKILIKEEAIINDSTFNAEINDSEIEGNINNCTFEKLSGGIKVIGPLNNVNILVDMTPTAARYVENPENNSILIENNPFIISAEKVPKLTIQGRKVCSIATKSYNGSDVKVFIVTTTNEDYTPSGIIVMFSGIASLIPDGWAICDGTRGTPDLRGRFIRMVSLGENPGAQNNSDLVTNGTGTRQAYLKGNKVPKHTHTFNSYSNTITVNGSSLSASYNGDVTLTLGVSFSNLSTNDVWTNGIWNLSLLTFTPRSSSDPNLGSFGYLTNSGEYNYKVWSHNKDFEHHHTITAGSASITGSLPSISISGNISIPINFTPTQDPDETGFVEAVNVEPLAYALIFIMKL